MNKIPICLNVDDPSPIVSVYYDHVPTHLTRDGRLLEKTIPNTFLDQFCDIAERYGIKGKFSVVPQPGNRGDITKEITGYDNSLLKEWLDTVKNRVAPRFSICPEMLTHHMAVDIETGSILDQDEDEWSKTQNRSTLTPYISYALTLLKQVGFNPCGVTSPWQFAWQVEAEYLPAISQAVSDTCGTDNAWVLQHSRRDVPNAKPWVAFDDGIHTVVAIPNTTYDHFWKTINDPDTSERRINEIADMFITEDGTKGEIVRVLDTNGWPILCSHWQSLFSNGSAAGLRILEIVADRITTHLSDQVQWMSFEEIMTLVLADKTAYPKPTY